MSPQTQAHSRLEDETVLSNLWIHTYSISCAEMYYYVVCIVSILTLKFWHPICVTVRMKVFKGVFRLNVKQIFTMLLKQMLPLERFLEYFTTLAAKGSILYPNSWNQEYFQDLLCSPLVLSHFLRAFSSFVPCLNH